MRCLTTARGRVSSASSGSIREPTAQTASASPGSSSIWCARAIRAYSLRVIESVGAEPPGCGAGSRGPRASLAVERDRAEVEQHERVVGPLAPAPPGGSARRAPACGPQGRVGVPGVPDRDVGPAHRDARPAQAGQDLLVDAVVTSAHRGGPGTAGHRPPPSARHPHSPPDRKRTASHKHFRRVGETHHSRLRDLSCANDNLMFRPIQTGRAPGNLRVAV